jgi:DNA-binding XRE family transcriptional regulator
VGVNPARNAHGGYHIPWYQSQQADSILAVAKKSSSYAHDPALVALGDAIRRLRQSGNKSQESLALEAGLDRSYLGGIERGEHNFALINLVKIAACLNLAPSALLAAAGL